MSYRYCLSCKYFDHSDDSCLNTYFPVDIMYSCPKWEQTNNIDLSLKLLNIKIDEIYKIKEFYIKELRKLTDTEEDIMYFCKGEEDVI
jgi:hypothetical protein